MTEYTVVGLSVVDGVAELCIFTASSIGVMVTRMRQLDVFAVILIEEVKP